MSSSPVCIPYECPAGYNASNPAERPLNLLSLPPEIIEHIAFLLAQLSPFDPPKDVFALAFCNKNLKSRILPQCNHRIWAKLFRARFDHAAITRRFGKQNAEILKDAFIQRTTALNRIRNFDDQPDSVSLQDLWLAYLMLLEHG